MNLVLNSKTLRNTERKAEVTKIEKVEVEVEDEVEVVTREAYDKSLESFLVAIDTLHSTLFREGKEVECGGMNKYLRLSPLSSSSSSSSSSTCERFVAPLCTSCRTFSAISAVPSMDPSSMRMTSKGPQS